METKTTSDVGLSVRHENPEMPASAEAGSRVCYLTDSGKLPVCGWLTFAAEAERPGPVRFSAECGGSLRTLEVLARLAKPIAGRTTSRVYVLSFGTADETIVCDADTGAPIPFRAVRIEMIGGEIVVARVTAPALH